jgi:hypothetical protein
MTRRLGLALVLLASFGCSAEEACGDDFRGVALNSSRHAGSAVLSAAGDSTSRIYHASLTGLPELWQPDSAILNATIATSLTLKYSTGSPGSDGRTQMPRLGFAITRVDEEPSTAPPATPDYPDSRPLGFSASIFGECWEGGPPICCVWGSTSCEGRLRLSIQRFDGEPFPPIEVSFETSASANVSLCPTNRGDPELVLEEEPLP